MQDLVERPPFGDRGHVAEPRVPWAGIRGLGLAFRMCRDGDTGLAQHVKRIPDEYVSEVSLWQPGRKGPEASVVACLCGAATIVRAELAECECGRFMFAGDRGVYAIRLPESA